MFIPNYNKTALINVDHIRRVDISAPKFEQKDYWALATLDYGTAILHKGTEESCLQFLAELYRTLG